MQKRLQDVLRNAAQNYILPFYWQHGEDAQLLQEGLRQIHKCGIGEVCLEARPHPDYVGVLWWRDIDIILAEAKKLGMRVWVLDDAHFPTGNCNGKITITSPYRKFVLAHYGIDVIGPMRGASFSVDLKENERFVGAVAAKREKQRDYFLSDIQDISDCLYGDVLEWDVPEGLYTIIVMKVTDRHSGRQGYANLIDRDAVRFLIDTVYEPHYKHCKADFGKTFAGFFSDEPEIGNTWKDIPDPGNSYAGNPAIALPWCKELQERLKEVWGKKYCENLVLLWNSNDEDPQKTNRTGLIRKQYTDLVTKLYQKNFCEQLGQWCEEHGVEYIGHIIEGARLGCGVGHYFRGLWGQHMSGVDVVLQSLRPGFDDFHYYRIGGSTLSGGAFNCYGLAKLASSLAHIDEKKNGRALCEIFGAYGWAEGVKMMKWLTDHMLVRGINYYVPHAFSVKGFPDEDCPPHFWALGNNPQFGCFQKLMRYMNRVCHLINGGVHQADVGIVYSNDLEWLDRNTMSFHIPAQQLTQHQVDFDILPVDTLFSSDFSNAKLKVGQETYSVLVIPECSCMENCFAEWCEAAAAQGVTIVATNRKPNVLQEDGRIIPWEFKGIRVIPLEQIGECLHIGKCGLNLVRTNPDLRYYHYVHDDGEYYLLFNESIEHEIETFIEVEKMDCQEIVLYNAWDNCLEQVEMEAVSNRIKIHLHPSEMKVLCICQVIQTFVHPTVPLEGGRVPLKATWTLKMIEAGSTQCYKEITDFCLSNTTASHGGDPSFSGTMYYRAEFEMVQENLFVGIDLGAVYETAVVKLNGKLIGSKIQPPYCFATNGLLKSGMNILEVEVTNTLVHRVRDSLSLSLPIEPSGILGPVSLILRE